MHRQGRQNSCHQYVVRVLRLQTTEINYRVMLKCQKFYSVVNYNITDKMSSPLGLQSSWVPSHDPESPSEVKSKLREAIRVSLNSSYCSGRQTHWVQDWSLCLYSRSPMLCHTSLRGPEPREQGLSFRSLQKVLIYRGDDWTSHSFFTGQRLPYYDYYISILSKISGSPHLIKLCLTSGCLSTHTDLTPTPPTHSSKSDLRLVFHVVYSTLLPRPGIS